MFVLSQSATYSWPVEVSLPTNGGKHEKQTFDAIFKRITQKRLKEYLEPVDPDDKTLTDESLCREVLAGFKGIVDDKGEQVPFSETALEELLNIPQVAKAIAVAYLQSVSGAKAKN
jgi:hypothetical protein